MSKNEPKYKIGQAVIIPKLRAIAHEKPIEAHIADFYEFKDTNGYHVLSYDDEGSISLTGSNTIFTEDEITEDNSRNDLDDIKSLQKDLRRDFGPSDLVIVDVSPLEKSIFETRKSVWKRGSVTGIFLNASHFRNDFWDRVKVGVKLEDSQEIQKFRLERVQHDWNNPGKPELMP